MGRAVMLHHFRIRPDETQVFDFYVIAENARKARGLCDNVKPTGIGRLTYMGAVPPGRVLQHWNNEE